MSVDGTPLGFVPASTLYDPASGERTARADATREAWRRVAESGGCDP